LPVMVKVEVPTGVELATAMVRIAVAGVVPALKDPTTPEGRPARVTVTVPSNPF